MLEAQGPTMQDELLALKQQRDAQEMLIENLRVQVDLGEQRATALMQINEELQTQLD